MVTCLCAFKEEIAFLGGGDDGNRLASSPYKGTGFSHMGEYCLRHSPKKSSGLGKHLISLKINYSECRFRYRLQGEIIELVSQA